jgi:hypothetical protein
VPTIAISLLRAGGLMAIDNVFWSGRVADPRERGKDTMAVRALNEKIRDDERVDLHQRCPVPILTVPILTSRSTFPAEVKLLQNVRPFLITFSPVSLFKGSERIILKEAERSKSGYFCCISHLI